MVGDNDRAPNSEFPEAPGSGAIHTRHVPWSQGGVIMTTRRRLLVLALFLPTAAMAPTSPSAPVEALDQTILAVMHAGRTRSFAQRMQMLTPTVQAAFDLPLILGRAVGPRFATFPSPVQDALLEVFTEFTVASYVTNFDDYNGERFDILPQTRGAGTDEVVQTLLRLADGDTVKLDYVVHQRIGSWKIIDVLLNGAISRVAVQRSDFRSLLGGGDAAPLIASLRGKVLRLAAGQKD